MPEFSDRVIGLLQSLSNTEVSKTNDYNEDKLQLSQSSPCTFIQAKKKTITIGKKSYSVDAYDLISMIRRVTSNIGQYNENENEPFAAYMVHALRTARNDMASALEANFKIHFTIDDGKSIFYIG